MDAEDSIAADRQRKVRQRVFKEKPYKVMHVCMATDVQVAKLRDERPWSPKHYFKEHVLLSVRVYSDGLLEMSPEFSRVLEEDESRAHLHSSGTAPSVFMSNKRNAVAVTMSSAFIALSTTHPMMWRELRTALGLPEAEHSEEEECEWGAA